MNYTYMQSTQQPPASIPTRQAKNNGLVRNNPKGMPQKFDVSDGTSSFAQGRGAFAQKAPSNFGRSMFLRAKTGPKNAQGIPVPNHSSSDVTYMKKMAAMGKNTSRKTNPSGDTQFKNHDKNTVNRARRYCRSGGCVAPPKKAANINFKNGGGLCSCSSDGSSHAELAALTHYHAQRATGHLIHLKQQGVDITSLLQRTAQAGRIVVGHPDALSLEDYSLGSTPSLDDLVCKFLVEPLADALIATSTDFACEAAANAVFAGIDFAMGAAGVDDELIPEVVAEESSSEGAVSAICDAVGDAAAAGRSYPKCKAVSSLNDALGMSCDC